MNTPLVCGSCSACCRWGENHATLAPPLEVRDLEYHDYRHAKTEGGPRLAADKNGNCVYLGAWAGHLSRGCTIHSHRPRFCRRFDCREAYDKVQVAGLDTPVLQVLIAGGMRRKQESKS